MTTLSLLLHTGGQPPQVRPVVAAPAKPGPGAGDAARADFIAAKYVRRMYGPWPEALPGGGAQAALWDAAENGDVRCAHFRMSGGLSRVQEMS